MCSYIMFKAMAVGRFIIKVFHYILEKVLFYFTLGTAVYFFEKTLQDFRQNIMLDFTSTPSPLLLGH